MVTVESAPSADPDVALIVFDNGPGILVGEAVFGCELGKGARGGIVTAKASASLAPAAFIAADPKVSFFVFVNTGNNIAAQAVLLRKWGKGFAIITTKSVV